MPLRRIVLYFVLTISLLAQRKPITIDTVMQQGYGRTTPPVVWAPDGRRFAYFQGGEIMLFDVAARSEKSLLSLGPLEKAAVPVAESRRFDWQNRRVSEDSLEWDHSGKRMLLSVRGDLFLFPRQRHVGTTHGHTRARARSQVLPRWLAGGLPAYA